ncbi:MAG: glycosyltransferase, partial [Verrucomicrobia bacterium]|nr:glycosyltransferase [Verrucomicrobiota bacterium]
MKILHLDGASEDFGGVLSVLRNVAEASRPLGWSHAVWVNETYVEKRAPSLDYRRSRHVVSDSPSHFKILFHAARASAELQRLLREENFDILHAHSRGALLAGLFAT